MIHEDAMQELIQQMGGMEKYGSGGYELTLVVDSLTIEVPLPPWAIDAGCD